MSGTFYPPSLDLPEGWPVGNSIGPISIPYEGPSLTAGPADVTFTLGSLTLTFPDDITVEPYVGPDLPVPGTEGSEPPQLFTPTELITINVFEPPTAGNQPYKLTVEYNTSGPNDLKRRDLVAGVWHLCAVPPSA